jgi:hypothetical protein
MPKDSIADTEIAQSINEEDMNPYLGSTLTKSKLLMSVVKQSPSKTQHTSDLQ